MKPNHRAATASKAFQAGTLYINAHRAAHPGGEISHRLDVNDTPGSTSRSRRRLRPYIVIAFSRDHDEDDGRYGCYDL